VRAVARAHPNIALIKYWGKAPAPGNVPAVPSLSITLDTLTTTTTVSESGADVFRLDGRQSDDPRVAACLDNLRRRYDIPPLSVQSDNDFPTAAGLASSASGFAALVTAVDAAFGLRMTPAERSELARQASASAARSVFGGFVTLEAPAWTAEPLLDEAEWPLRVIIAVTDTASKAVPSSDGMRRSAATSPFYPAWVDSAGDDFRSASSAVLARDFAMLADLAEHSCLKMHGLMLSSRPGLLYWNAATLACLHRIRALRADGEAVFFTVDAGPQVKAVCLPESEGAVVDALSGVSGVRQLLVSGLGPGAWVDGS
jgi:diphosphomevalonate decarboxylase